MLDSGAYGAARRGLSLDVRSYSAFAHATEGSFDNIINLDLIAPSPHEPEEIEEAARLSYSNLLYMQGKGLKPIPVFHQGDRWKWLERMLKDGHRSIAIATLKHVAPQEVMPWLADAFSIIPPGVRVHGLGIMTPRIVTRFPWTTVDATTWVQGYGDVPIPRFTKAKPDFQLDHMKLPITARSSSRVHLDTIEDWQRRMVERWFDYIDINLVDARNIAECRWRVWIAFLLALQASCGVEIVFGTNMSSQQQKALVAGGVQPQSSRSSP